MLKDKYVAVLPNGSEHFGEWEENRRGDSYERQKLCDDAVRNFDMTTPRRKPVAVKVELFRLDVINGQLVRKSCGMFDVTPPLERMTDDEYTEEMNEILKELPKEFRSYVQSAAYDRGHSSGCEEIVSIASEMADELVSCIVAYTKRIKAELK